MSLQVRSFEEILASMLGAVSDEYDKREGSVIYSALAPVAAELAITYAFLADYLNLLLPDTAVGEYLDRLCAVCGLSRKGATNAVITAAFYDAEDAPLAIDQGQRFYANGVYYIVSEPVSDGVYRLNCETAGTAGNQTSGDLMAVDLIEGLARAEIVGIFTYGAEAEDDESLRQRYQMLLSQPAFGGNVSDYRLSALSLAGVGTAAVFPAWQGGGSVKLIIGGLDQRAVDDVLVETVQDFFMPAAADGLGSGQAPIGHTVSVESAVDLPLAIAADLVLATGVTLTDIQTDLEAAVASYIGGLAFEQDKIHISPLVVTLLSNPAVIDVQSLTVNGESTTLVLDKTAELYQVPVFGSLTLEAVQ